MNKQYFLEKLNLKDPYPYIKSLNIPPSISPAWGGKADIFDSIIRETKPKLIIELGAFLGSSTITMANSIKKHNLNCVVITVDTWLGSQEHWLKDKCNLLHLYDNFEFGISSLYNKFAANVIHEGLEDYILPVPTTTDTAFDIFKSLNLKPDVIYMDADHREEVVYSDLNKYSQILNDKGVIFGHDIDWIGVSNAVNRYCSEKNKALTKIEDNLEHQIKFWRIA